MKEGASVSFAKAPISSGSSFARFVELLTDGRKEGKGTASRGAWRPRTQLALLSIRKDIFIFPVRFYRDSGTWGQLLPRS